MTKCRARTIQEYRAFSEARALAERLADDLGWHRDAIALGLFAAALSDLRAERGEVEVAKLLYTAADSYALGEDWSQAEGSDGGRTTP